jgi:hypothetical protein
MCTDRKLTLMIYRIGYLGFSGRGVRYFIKIKIEK